jgi:hypothetical protein
MRMKPSHSLAGTALALALTLATGASAADKRTLCVFDLSGANGDTFAAAKEYQTAAIAWGIDFELKPYSNEKAAADDLRAGKCNAALITGIRARQFNKFTGTLEAIGGIPTYDVLKRVISQLLDPNNAVKLGPYLKSGDFEVAGIFPIGAVYLFVDDKSMNTKEKLAGKKIATLDYDQAAVVMVDVAGAAMTAADITNFAGMFNNGAVDACYAPAAAYKPLELQKGLKGAGGVIRLPLSMLSVQLVAKAADFPADFAVKSRAYSLSRFPAMLALAKKAEAGIAADKWVDIAAADKDRYDQLFQDVRVRLRDKENVFHKDMLRMLLKARCAADSARAECAAKRE